MKTLTLALMIYAAVGTHPSPHRHSKLRAFGLDAITVGLVAGTAYAVLHGWPYRHHFIL